MGRSRSGSGTDFSGGVWGVGGDGHMASVGRITEHKRHVCKTEWVVSMYNPMDDNEVVLAGPSGDMVEGVYLHVCVCGVSWCPKREERSERMEGGL